MEDMRMLQKYRTIANKSNLCQDYITRDFRKEKDDVKFTEFFNPPHIVVIMTLQV